MTSLTRREHWKKFDPREVLRRVDASGPGGTRPITISEQTRFNPQLVRNLLDMLVSLDVVERIRQGVYCTTNLGHVLGSAYKNEDSLIDSLEMANWIKTISQRSRFFVIGNLTTSIFSLLGSYYSLIWRGAEVNVLMLDMINGVGIVEDLLKTEPDFGPRVVSKLATDGLRHIRQSQLVDEVVEKEVRRLLGVATVNDNTVLQYQLIYRACVLLWRHAEENTRRTSARTRLRIKVHKEHPFIKGWVSDEPPIAVQGSYIGPEVGIANPIVFYEANRSEIERQGYLKLRELTEQFWNRSEDLTRIPEVDV